MKGTKRMNLLAPFAVVLVGAASCAIGNSDRRLLLNYLDNNLTPSSQAGRLIASPLALPVGIAAGVVDAAVVHPLTQLDDAWVDTVQAVWDYEGMTDFRTSLLMPLSAVSTPVVFGITWVFRSVFDVDDSTFDPDEEPVVARLQGGAK